MLGLSSAQMQAIAREMNLSEFENRERIAHALGLNADALLDGIAEDPATGSASGPLTMLLRKANLIAGGDPIEAVSEQGTKMGRRSLIALRSHADGRIEVGGRAVQIMTAELTI